MKDNDRTRATLRELVSLFPYDVARPTQSAALEVIAKMFRENFRYNIIEAPTGTGKSALAFASARYAASLDNGEFERGAYILTPYNNLADQMVSDFRHLGLASLRGRKHYDAKHGATYEMARRDFAQSDVGVTSYAYFLKAGHLPDRQALILDEAHSLERILLDSAGFRITRNHCRAIEIDVPLQLGERNRDQMVDWFARVFLPALRKQAGRRSDMAVQLNWEDLTDRVTAFVDADDRHEWFAWTDEGDLNARPLSVVSQAQHLFSRARFVLIQSATIFDFPTFKRILGISEEALMFSAPSDFPLENRPIISRPVGNMAAKTVNEAIPSLCIEAERIVNEFRRSKGVIHSHSYLINHAVCRHLVARFGNRIITHGQNPSDRENAIRRHCASDQPSVLVSPSLTEGVDLKDDLARFQIVCKLPYPRLDAYTRARCARDRGWYELQTAWALAQMIGRAVRSETDSAVTFVLDSQFEKFVARNERTLPNWWRAAIQWERIAA